MKVKSRLGSDSKYENIHINVKLTPLIISNITVAVEGNEQTVISQVIICSNKMERVFTDIMWCHLWNCWRTASVNVCRLPLKWYFRSGGKKISWFMTRVPFFLTWRITKMENFEIFNQFGLKQDIDSWSTSRPRAAYLWSLFVVMSEYIIMKQILILY